MIKPTLVVFIIFSLFLRLSLSARVVCYYLNWAKYKPGDDQYQTANVDPTLCTHIIYAYITFDENGDIVQDEWIESVKEVDVLISAKEKNPDLKVLLSIGGWDEPSSTYSQVVADAEKRQNLLHSIYTSVGLYGVDGLDIDWAYPGQRGGDAENDATNFVTLLSELKSLLTTVNVTLSISVPANQNSMNVSFPDAKTISDNVDQINVLWYNGSIDVSSGNSLTPKPQDLNIAIGIKRWIDGGADTSKLNLGLNTTGRIVDIDGPGDVDIALGFNEICQLGSDWEDSWDDVQQLAVKSNGTHRILYENAESLKVKVDLIKELNLGGAAIWSLDNDDFHGNCGSIYPLVNTIKDNIN